ncbi:MAG: HAMP domain-containing sensor histidine kinase [Clostridia bacterium]|nr:HAMP domain-containing sensor histidine kinase [Clostridia bacterium]
MRYRDRIFRQYVVLSTAVITASFLLLGVVLMIFMSDYWKRDKAQTLDKVAQSVAYLSQNNLLKANNKLYMTNSDAIQSFIDLFSKTCDVDLLIVDNSGNIFMCSSGNDDYNTKHKISETVIREWQADKTCRSSDLGGFFENQRLVSAYPVEITVKNRQEIVALAFVTTGSQYYDMFLEDSTKAIIIIFIIVFLLSSAIMIYLNYNTYRPIKQISVAVRNFTKGDFSQRVKIQRNDEIGDLAQAFNNMAESLSVSEDARRSFIANVSHELKTPMTTISGFIDGIIDQTIPQEKEKYYLEIVSEETKRLSRLVTMMLDLSRIDNDSMELRKEKVNITSIIAKIIIGFEKRIEEKNINIYGLDNISDITLLGDYDKLYQVVYNLIDNAVKFTPDNGYINIIVKQEDKIVSVEIENSGMGISAEDVPFIFDRFYKTDKSRSKDKKGMGLGLYIVKKIINLHSGNIEVQSIEGEYCVFKFWLPIK